MTDEKYPAFLEFRTKIQQYLETTRQLAAHYRVKSNQNFFRRTFTDSFAFPRYFRDRAIPQIIGALEGFKLVLTEVHNTLEDHKENVPVAMCHLCFTLTSTQLLSYARSIKQLTFWYIPLASYVFDNYPDEEKKRNEYLQLVRIPTIIFNDLLVNINKSLQNGSVSDLVGRLQEVLNNITNVLNNYQRFTVFDKCDWKKKSSQMQAKCSSGHKSEILNFPSLDVIYIPPNLRRNSTRILYNTDKIFSLAVMNVSLKYDVFLSTLVNKNDASTNLLAKVTLMSALAETHCNSNELSSVNFSDLQNETTNVSLPGLLLVKPIPDNFLAVLCSASSNTQRENEELIRKMKTCGSYIKHARDGHMRALKKPLPQRPGAPPIPPK